METSRTDVPKKVAKPESKQIQTAKLIKTLNEHNHGVDPQKTVILRVFSDFMIVYNK